MNSHISLSQNPARGHKVEIPFGNKLKKHYVPRFSVPVSLLPFHFIFAFFPSISIDDMGATSGVFFSFRSFKLVSKWVSTL